MHGTHPPPVPQIESSAAADARQQNANELRELREQLRSAQRDSHALSERASEALKEAERSRSLLDVAQRERDELAFEVGELRMMREQFSALMKTLEEAVAQRQALEAQVVEVHSLRERLERATCELSESNLAQGALRERAQASQRAITELEGQLADVTRQCARVRADADAAASREAQARAESRELRAELDAQQAGASNGRLLRDRLAELEEALSKVRRRMRQVTGSLSGGLVLRLRVAP